MDEPNKDKQKKIKIAVSVCAAVVICVLICVFAFEKASTHSQQNVLDISKSQTQAPIKTILGIIKTQYIKRLNANAFSLFCLISINM